MKLQRALQVVFPNSCISCNIPVDEEQALCGTCWARTSFITGLICDSCGTPLPGEADAGTVHCDDCLKIARPWEQGRAALIYSGNARRLVLALKHGDRQDLAKPAARWMRASAGSMITPETVVVPVPSHWTRLLRRKYNQAALLAVAIARESGVVYEPQTLIRPRVTKVHDGMGLDARFANMSGAIAPHGKYGGKLTGKSVLLIDDVMTSGATLAAATEACHAAGAATVSILVLARVAKDA